MGEKGGIQKIGEIMTEERQRKIMRLDAENKQGSDEKKHEVCTDNYFLSTVERHLL